MSNSAPRSNDVALHQRAQPVFEVPDFTIRPDRQKIGCPDLECATIRLEPEEPVLVTQAQSKTALCRSMSISLRGRLASGLSLFDGCDITTDKALQAFLE